MAIDAGGAGEELRIGVPAAANRDRQSNRRPKRIAAADPVPDRQYVGSRDAERARRLVVAGDRDEVRAKRTAGAQRMRQPRARRVRVGERFAGRECLRGHDEQGRRRIEPGQCARQVLGIDVGDERDVGAVGALVPRLGERIADELAVRGRSRRCRSRSHDAAACRSRPDASRRGPVTPGCARAPAQRESARSRRCRRPEAACRPAGATRYATPAGLRTG